MLNFVKKKTFQTILLPLLFHDCTAVFCLDVVFILIISFTYVIEMLKK